jgi:hypothetical protein
VGQSRPEIADPVGQFSAATDIRAYLFCQVHGPAIQERTLI